MDNIQYPGLYRGYVVENKDWEKVIDKKKLLRLQVNVPSVYGDSIQKDKLPWASAKLDFAGPNYGMFRIPNIGERVWIQFEGGNPQYPVWGGTWILEGDIPPELYTDISGSTTETAYRENFIIKSCSGWGIKFCNEGIEVYHKKQEIQVSGGGSQRPKVVVDDSYEGPSIKFTNDASLAEDSDVGVLLVDLKDFDLIINSESKIKMRSATIDASAANMRLFASNTHLAVFAEGSVEEAGDMLIGAIKNYRVGSPNGSCKNGSWRE